MKQKSKKILIAMIVIILIVGATVLLTKGLAFDLIYANSKKVEINLGKQFEKKDIRIITDEVFGKQPVQIQEIEVYKDAISIMTTEITNEQKTQLITKINEKYGTEISADDITIEEYSHIRGRDFIKPYITPFVIATVIILIYLAIRYYKLNSLKVLIQTIGIIILSQLVLLGIMVITRMPIGTFTIPTILFVYMLSTYVCITKFESDLQKLVVNKNK